VKETDRGDDADDEAGLGELEQGEKVPAAVGWIMDVIVMSSEQEIGSNGEYEEGEAGVKGNPDMAEVDPLYSPCVMSIDTGQPGSRDTRRGLPENLFFRVWGLLLLGNLEAAVFSGLGLENKQG
jgi:hypothetical protein